jgi:hypothetical protein
MKIMLLYGKYGVVLGPGARPKTVDYCCLRNVDFDSGRVELSIGVAPASLPKDVYIPQPDYQGKRDPRIFKLESTGILVDGRVNVPRNDTGLSMFPPLVGNRIMPYAEATEKFRAAVLRLKEAADL